MAVGTEVLYHKAVVDSIPHKTGEIYRRNRETQLLTYKVKWLKIVSFLSNKPTWLEILLDESLESGEDCVVHDKLPLVHGRCLQGPGNLYKPVKLSHVLTGLVKHLKS